MTQKPSSAMGGPQNRSSYLRFRLWARRVELSRKLTYLLMVLAAVSGIATFATTVGSGYGAPVFDMRIIVGLLYLDAALLLALGVLVLRRFLLIWNAWRKGSAGSKLHTRMILLFSTVAVTPAIFVAVFATIFLDFGMQSWFSERVKTVVSESGRVALAYLSEHQRSIESDLLASASAIDRNAPLLVRSQDNFRRLLNSLSLDRALDEVAVIDESGAPLARADGILDLDYSFIPSQAFQSAQSGNVHILAGSSEDQIRGMVRLNSLPDAYLIVGRYVSAEVLQHVERARIAAEEYDNLQNRSTGIQISFVAIFVLVALLLLMVAASVGLTFSNRLMQPIASLIDTAHRVGKGDLKARALGSEQEDELGLLIRSFNRMAEQIETQRNGLVAANEELDDRRRFTEAVLAGVSAGVIGLDDQGAVDLPNRTASALLDVDLRANRGKPLVEVVPEMADVLARAMQRPGLRLDPSEILIQTRDGARTLVVNVTSETSGEDVLGFVVTFDDVTDLVTAQRTAAWADVARRIAHEIKNPLTPIQLAAERLSRKYRKEIVSDPDIFETCTRTIINHVEDIERMVDEFRDFARMPQPAIAQANLSEICREAVFLERTRSRSVAVSLDLPEEDFFLDCDAKQVTRALTNILKNATESVLHSPSGEQGDGAVSVALRFDAETATIRVSDNGNGFPADLRDRLTEPYVTTRDKGTGLGLAIVKKILEDHGGALNLGDRDGGGALVELVLSRGLKMVEAETSSTADPIAQALKTATRMTTDGI
ncbi:MAG: ATP-binding protein [Magnetospiraceae bacterium]